MSCERFLNDSALETSGLTLLNLHKLVYNPTDTHVFLRLEGCHHVFTVYIVNIQWCQIGSNVLYFLLAWW